MQEALQKDAVCLIRAYDGKKKKFSTQVRPSALTSPSLPKNETKSSVSLAGARPCCARLHAFVKPRCRHPSGVQYHVVKSLSARR